MSEVKVVPLDDVMRVQVFGGYVAGRAQRASAFAGSEHRALRHQRGGSASAWSTSVAL